MVTNAQWEANDDKSMWTLKLILETEANYSFTLSYTDPSGRQGYVEGTTDTTYEGAVTLDRTAPWMSASSAARRISATMRASG